MSCFHKKRLTPVQSSFQKSIARIVLLAALTFGSALIGCGSSPVATSPQSQELILRFYTACNTQSPERLASAMEAYESLITQNLVNSEEQECFNTLIALAEKGRWQEAADRAYEFSQAQVR
jgi:hypothetical protein